MKFKQIGLPLVIVGMTAVVISLMIATRPELTPEESPERVWPVQAIAAKHQDMQPTLDLFGEVVAGRRSELRPQVAGVIVEMGKNLHEGSFVERGELLLRIDPFDYETGLAEQRSLLREAEARLEKLRRDLKRARDLFAEKNVSEQFLDDAELAVAEQEALVEQRSIGVRRAERDLRDTRLLAPFDGVLANVNADLGKQISDFGAEMIAEIIDTSRLEVRFNLSNAQYGRLLDSGEPVIGRAVEVVWEVGGDALRYPATIERVGAEITATTGGVELFAVIDSAGKQTELRPGAFVSVNVADKRYPAVLTAPDTALYGENTVYVVEDGRMSPRTVRVLGYAGSDIFLASDGEPAIVDGDNIVITQLREGGAGVRVVLR
ncbi:MAG: efflux RND transporter periplasmic adaptor subunit [Gammaproteobacteria bacterium]|nr:efflux RND transporter periplasmic adaptor subunit [Gammaproteobacteria bacterium]